jgi:hypothetical protein
MPLTTLAESAPAEANTLKVVDPFDLTPLDSDPTAKKVEIQLAPPGNPFGGRPAQVKAVDGAMATVELVSPLDVALVKGTVVLGQGFKLVVRCDGQTEVFDNLSMSPAHGRYFAAVINGPDEAMPYTERQSRGHSILIRADYATGSSRFRPVVTKTVQKLADGGDGFRYSAGILRDADEQESIRLVARSAQDNDETLGSKGNALRVRATLFVTRTALAAAAGEMSIVVENADDLVPTDSVTITDPNNAAVTETRTIASVGADNNTLILTAGLMNAYPLGAKVTVQDRFTLAVFQGDALEPVEVHRNLSADPTDSRYFRGLLEVAFKKGDVLVIAGHAQNYVLTAV